MINFWGTFCGPCINEMPYLAEIEKAYKDQGFEILGMTCDVYDSEGNYQDDIVLDAQDIVDDTGVEYPILIASVELKNYAKLTAYPTTFFVDSEGNLLTSPIVGSHTQEEWEAYIEEALAAVN
jgi:thiol-disulfide isomerase/thioredoxin